ncbi:hypothetical protein NDU88_004131 [Pleurodeles waltl]|uniref:Uncharacterized protein n=1 Tax=Pleurodeles waltl TaxID=8319 RepID=A0AAV7M635_PLEWA|nr:hypothetical protein NDU88_004131 [Pleurodeles waltl]
MIRKHETPKAGPTASAERYEALARHFLRKVTDNSDALLGSMEETACVEDEIGADKNKSRRSTFALLTKEDIMRVGTSVKLGSLFNQAPIDMLLTGGETMTVMLADMIYISLEKGCTPKDSKQTIIRPLLKKSDLDPEVIKKL